MENQPKNDQLAVLPEEQKKLETEVPVPEQAIEQPALSPEEQLAGLDNQITTQEQEITKLTGSIEGTVAKLNAVRGELALPPSEELPPSVATEKDALEKLKKEQVELERKKVEITKEQLPETEIVSNEVQSEVMTPEAIAMEAIKPPPLDRIEELDGLLYGASPKWGSVYGLQRTNKEKADPELANKETAEKIGDELFGLPAGSLEAVRFNNTKTWSDRNTGLIYKYSTPESKTAEDFMNGINKLKSIGLERFASLPEVKIIPINENGSVLLQIQKPVGIEGSVAARLWTEVTGKSFDHYGDLALYEDMRSQNPTSKRGNAARSYGVEVEGTLRNGGLLLGKDGNVRFIAFDNKGVTDHSETKYTQDQWDNDKESLSNTPDMKGVPLTSFTPEMQKIIRENQPK